MVANDPSVIAANFASVAAGAEAIVGSARGITTMLEEFHTQVKTFVDDHWEGDANEAFAALQGQWNARTQELNGTLNAAGGTVLEGNRNLQATDAANAVMFQ